MGGMRTLEWLLCQPHRVHRAIVGAEASADQVAICRVQIDAIRADPNWHRGDYYDTPASSVTGMMIARRIAHLTYRSAAEVDTLSSSSPVTSADRGKFGALRFEFPDDGQYVAAEVVDFLVVVQEP